MRQEKFQQVIFEFILFPTEIQPRFPPKFLARDPVTGFGPVWVSGMELQDPVNPGYGLGNPN